MGTTDKSLELIFKQLIAGNAGMAIAETETYLAAWPNPQTQQKLGEMKTEYQLIEEHWQTGAEDPQRDELYQHLLQRLYVLVANISIYKHMNSSSFLQGIYKGVRQEGRKWSMTAIKAEMENFVSEVAMLSLEPENKRKEKENAIYQQHQKEMNALFNYVLTTHMWTDSVGKGMEEILLLPTIDSNDQQLLVAAITLSVMNRFDIVKFRTLTHVYRDALDEQVRQRALVGWVLAIDDDWMKVYPEMQQLTGELLGKRKVLDELTELQMQLIYTACEREDTMKIKEEIMPDLIKNNSFKMTQEGLVEQNDDPLEDVLHPDAAEQRMEKLEDSVRRMMDMQKQGADIYFGGFSQMKRYPFFYDMSNWFVPFFIQHPDIAQYVEKVKGFPMMETAMKRGPLCDSDKYSFLIAFQQVMNQLPDSILQMMKRGEASLLGGNEVDIEELRQPAFIRRNYLMDLYRFFVLFPNRQMMYNPFMKTKNGTAQSVLFFTSALFLHTPLDERKREVVKMVKKRRLDMFSNMLLDSFPEEMRDLQYYLWTEDYWSALELDPENEKALAGSARESFRLKQYDKALDIYERLLLKYPEKTSYMLNKAVCLVNLEEYEDAQKVLYQLNYERPDDLGVAHVLAWSLTCSGKMEQAESLYQQLMAQEQPDESDYLNYGYSLWLQKRINEAIAQFRKYLKIQEEKGLPAELQLDEAWLQARGITEVEIRMMRFASEK